MWRQKMTWQCRKSRRTEGETNLKHRDQGFERVDGLKIHGLMKIAGPTSCLLLWKSDDNLGHRSCPPCTCDDLHISRLCPTTQAHEARRVHRLLACEQPRADESILLPGTQLDDVYC